MLPHATHCYQGPLQMLPHTTHCCRRAIPEGYSRCLHTTHHFIGTIPDNMNSIHIVLSGSFQDLIVQFFLTFTPPFPKSTTVYGDI